MDWPANGVWRNLHEKPTQFHARRSWRGSLLRHGRDASGQWHCVEVDWPALGMWMNLDRKPTDYRRRSWMGSLLVHGRDPSGQYYRRNRFYDADTGRFTQEDPIGLAGGLNVYGFANGDPVSYSDPYGLCPQQAEEGSVCIDLFIQKQSEMGFKGDGRGFDPNAPPERSRVQVVAKDGMLVSSHISDSCGNVTGCHDALPYAPDGPNRVWTTRQRDGTFTVNVHAKNSAAGVRGFSVAPAINASVTFHPDGSGGYTTSGNRDAMPSLGVYQYRDGAWQVLQERPEKGGAYLFPFMRNDKW